MISKKRNYPERKSLKIIKQLTLQLSFSNTTLRPRREELARLYGTSVQEAADIIGNQLDCAPHEDISGYIFMVPNWAHKWFRHNGYVSRMLK